MTWTYVDTIPGVSSGGPNPLDSFSIGLKFQDTNSGETDAMSVAFTFPDSISAQSDLAKLALIFADANTTLSDTLLRLSIAVADNVGSQSEAVALQIVFSEPVAVQSDNATIAFNLSDSSVSPVDLLLGLAIAMSDANGSVSDNSTFVFNLLQGDTIDAQSEVIPLMRISGMNDSNSMPTDGRTSTSYHWHSGTTGTSGNTSNVGNANGQNNSTNATAKTVLLGATTATLTCPCGPSIPSGISFTSAIYRGWWSYITGLTSTASVVLHSSSGAFTDVTPTSGSGAFSFLDGSYTVDLMAAGINTLAKLQTLQVLYKVVDVVAGSGGQLNIDAGRIELTNVL